jgi:hypothetical protein
MKISDFKSEEDLKKMTIPQIKMHVREYNEHYAIKGYSKLTKSQLISTVLTAQDRIRNAGKKAVAFKEPAPAPKRDLSKLTKPQLLKMLPENLQGGEVARQKKATILELVKQRQK